MTAFKASASRVPSRAGSAVRDIVKRREKQYRTEQKRVLERKRKLDIQTTYTNAPSGYVFVPVGTPDLSNRCKDLSRKQAYPVHVVNAKPVSKQALNVEKVSHHIHRIGYHFRIEIVEQACEELGYVPLKDKFVKPEDMDKPDPHTGLAKTSAKYGINLKLSTDTRESLDQVRAAIKELFPKIPELDLREIVNHAWEQGSDRVGTNLSMELPRRVQLAVIARIRHTYTDYDRLLRAFEWAEARKMVEPECLQKIIEWRGENDDQEEDQDLEEIVREIIVIDDDDDDDIKVIDGDNATDFGNISDTSIEITHQIALDDELGAESLDERSTALHNRFLPMRRTLAQRNDIARQKIGAAKKRMRDGIPVAAYNQPQYQSPLSHPESRVVIPQHRLATNREPIRAQYRGRYDIPQPLAEPFPVTPGDYHDRRKYSQRDEIVVGGQYYIRDQPVHVQPQPEYQYERVSQQTFAHAQPQHIQGEPSPIRPMHRYATTHALVSSTPQPYDRPVASIEHAGDYDALGYETYMPERPTHRRALPPPGPEIVDLTSPPRQQVYAIAPQDQIQVYSRPEAHAHRVMYQEQLPVHGAPAPVQYRVQGARPDAPARLPPQLLPTLAHGAAAPTQYYYERR